MRRELLALFSKEEPSNVTNHLGLVLYKKVVMTAGYENNSCFWEFSFELINVLFKVWFGNGVDIRLGLRLRRTVARHPTRYRGHHVNAQCWHTYLAVIDRKFGDVLHYALARFAR